MAFVGVAEVLVLHDEHISIANLFEGAKAQVADTELSHHHAAATATKGIDATGREEEKKGKDFITALNNTLNLRVGAGGGLHKEHTV